MHCRLFSKHSPKTAKTDLIHPNPPNYTILYPPEDKSRSRRSLGIRFQVVPFTLVNFNLSEVMNQFKWLTHTCYSYKKSLPNSKHQGQRLIILHIKSKVSNKLPFTILLSHGLSSDLGLLYPFLIDFSTQMKCDLIAYDYSGYGHSEGKASFAQLTSDIEEVGSFAVNVLMIKPSMMVLFGMSIGSIPTIHLGNAPEFNETLSGIILLSPYLLGFSKESVGLTSKEELRSKIKGIACPIFLIHGKNDEVVPYQHSENLAPCIKLLFKWFPSDGRHNNIISDYRRKFYGKLKTFIDELIDSFNDNLRGQSFQLNILRSPDHFNQKKEVVIEEDYAENGSHFEIGDQAESKRQILLEIFPEDKSPVQGGRPRQTIDALQLSYGNEDSYSDNFNSIDDIELVIDKPSPKKQKLKSPYLPSLKSPLKSPMKSAKQKHSTESPFLISQGHKKYFEFNGIAPTEIQ